MHFDELPNEILEYIIWLTLDSFGQTDVKDLQTFASVSRRWKDIVLNCPLLWSYISVAWDRIHQTLALKLRRSGNNLLEVDDSNTRVEQISCHEILGTAMHRLRALSSAQSQTEALPSLLGLDLTRLERLRLAISISLSPVHQRIGPTPRLRSLTLEGVTLTPTGGPFGGLRELTVARLPISSFMIQNLFIIIQNSPQLQSLTIQSILSEDASTAAKLLSSPGGTLELPLLTHLAVRRSETSLALAILNAVSAPRLQFLSVEGKAWPSSVPFFKAVTESTTRRPSLSTSILKNTKPNGAYLDIEYGDHMSFFLRVGVGRERLKLVLLDGGLPREMDEIAALINNVWTSSTFSPPSGIIVKLAGLEDSDIKPSQPDFGFLLKLPDIQIIASPCAHPGRVALLELLTDSSSHPSFRNLRRLDFMGYTNLKEDEELEPLARAFADKRELLRDVVPALPNLTILFGTKAIVSPKPEPPPEQESDDSDFAELFS
ncbi:hypothetical protein M407DRAFT_27440 [Tulasnella calospora MUT 4182]|uniref:F-box domain-containing protein n=1 Tax=Tulasnella calospora MUT 4182 TaxID=1051891 RepID=A0A0C3KNS5_9AGAM|nr:hypothetical protein M407DRAFT_27440 [Tulasnella calospora MUT 4182]